MGEVASYEPSPERMTARLVRTQSPAAPEDWIFPASRFAVQGTDAHKRVWSGILGVGILTEHELPIVYIYFKPDGTFGSHRYDR